MKKAYPNYNEGLGTKAIEENLSIKDKEILEDFLLKCRTSASEERVYKKIKPITLQFYDIIEKSYSEWTLKDIQHFIILLNDSNRTEWTKNDIKKILRRFLKVHYKKSDDLEEMLNLIKCKSDKQAFNHKKINEDSLINNSDFELMMRKCNTKQKAIFSLLFECGLRPQELRLLKWENININDEIGSISVYSNKTKEKRKLPIKTSVIHLKRYEQEFEYPNKRQDDFLFPKPNERNKPLSKNALPQMFRRISKKANIGRNIFPYLLRHSRITKINKELPAHLGCKFAGHSLKQSQFYTHLSSDDLLNAMNEKFFKLDDINLDRKQELEKEIMNIKREIYEIKELVKYLKN